MKSEILEELKNISPHLAQIGKVNIFKVPDGYFDELPLKLLTNVILHQDEKNKDQQVPGGYFEELSNKILSKIKNTETENAKEEIGVLSPVLLFLKGYECIHCSPGLF